MYGDHWILSLRHLPKINPLIINTPSSGTRFDFRQTNKHFFLEITSLRPIKQKKRGITC